MDKRKYKSSFVGKIFSRLGILIIFSMVLFFALTGFSDAQNASDVEGLRIAEESIWRAVISCFAAEGRYPPTFEYLQEHYGVTINEDRFIVHFNVFATNIMPDIVVLPRQGDGIW